MKKLLLIIIFLCATYCSSFADITIWCVGDYTETKDLDKTYKTKIDGMEEVRISDEFIKFVDNPTKPILDRDKDDTNLRFKAGKRGDGLKLDFYTIDRTTGVLHHWQMGYQKGVMTSHYYNCTSKKPELKF